MKRVSKGFSGVITPLFDTMLVQYQGEEPSIQTTPETSPSKITSSPSLSSHHTSISSPSTSQPPITPTEEAAPMPHESPLQSVHLLGRDEGSLSQNELMDLVTKLIDRIRVLEKDLQQTKKTYSTALTRLILRVKKLEKNVKTGKARRRARIVISEDEDAAEDSSKQGRKISDIDTYPTISLVQPQQDIEYDFDATASILVTTAGLEISTVSPPRVSTVEDISGAETLVYIRRSASKAKDKGKAIMQEYEPPKKIKKRAEQEQEKFDFKTALELQKKLDEREEVAAKEAHDIDWSDPSVLRYHALQNRPFSVGEVRKNMCMYLKNPGGYKMSHFKGMSYEEIRPIIERVWVQIQSFVPMDSEKEKGSEKKTKGRLKRAGQDVVEEPTKRQKTTEASESVQEQSSEEPKADELSQEQLQQMMLIVLEEGMHIEALQIKYLIIDWEVHSEDTMKFWKIIRVGNHTESLVKERFNSLGLTDDKEKELWAELKRLFEPDDTDTLWKLQRYMHDHLKRTIDQSAGGKLRDRNAKESWALLEDLTLYDNKSWNDPRDFAKPVKAISLPQDVPSTFDRSLIELENQVQRLMADHLAPTQPTQVNKITSLCEICSGPHDTQYCMENPEQAFVEYASSRTDKVGVLKAITDRIAGALPSDMVKNPKLNVNSTTLVLSARSYPMEYPQCLSQIHSSINAVTICPKQPNKPQDDESEGEDREERSNPENIDTTPPSPHDPTISFITEKVHKLDSFLASSGLVLQSSETEIVCTKWDDGGIMFIEIIRKNDDSRKEGPEDEGSATIEG
ncbi:hypothetical protein Tco_0154366 [Tanacetum coccineum]